MKAPASRARRTCSFPSSPPSRAARASASRSRDRSRKPTRDPSASRTAAIGAARARGCDCRSDPQKFTVTRVTPEGSGTSPAATSGADASICTIALAPSRRTRRASPPSDCTRTAADRMTTAPTVNACVRTPAVAGSDSAVASSGNIFAAIERTLYMQPRPRTAGRPACQEATMRSSRRPAIRRKSKIQCSAPSSLAGFSAATYLQRPMRVLLPLCAVLLFGCVRNPVTGKLQLDLLSESQEVEMGKQAKAEAEQAYGLYKDKPELTAYVAAIGKRLSAESGRPNLPWSYEIVDDASVNAFALPGGPVFITRGILGHLNTEAELAAVLGHETGHVAARHSANQMSKQQVAQLGLGLGSVLSPTVASATQVAGAGLQVLFLKYSRDDETQADELGFRYMTKIGYDPRQMIPLFQMLEAVSKEAGAGKTPEWLQTHPDPGNRLTATQDRLKNELKGSPEGMKVERDKYIRLVDGIVFGED